MEHDSARSDQDAERLRKATPDATDGVRNGSEGPGERLPPPMFPPGERRRPVGRTATPGVGGDDGVPEDAFIMPDEPMPRDDGETLDDVFEPEAWSTAKAAELADEAFIDPDDPIVRRQLPKKPSEFDQVVRRRPALDVDEVVVTGIGDDEHLDDEELGPDAVIERHVRELTRCIERLGDALRLRGEAGLRTTSDMTGFEATLRAYCVGYLTRVREEDGGS